MTRRRLLLQQAAGGGFSPTDIADCSLWLDASDATTITFGTGTLVAQWDDKSGAGRHVSQASSGNQPDRNTTVNGLDAITFNGSSTRLDRASTNVLNATTGAHTSFAVIRPTALSTTRNIVDQDPNAGTRYAQLIRHSTTTAQAISFRFGTAYIESTASGVLATSTTALITSRADTTTLEVWVDGVSNGSISTASGNLNTGNATLRIGADGGATPLAGSHFNGVICEVVVYSAALSTTDREAVQDYLTAKWGV